MLSASRALVLCLGIGLASSAHAGKNTQPEQSACDKLRPEQRLSEERQTELDSAIQAGIMGIGKGAASVDSSKSQNVSIQVLENDALATSWFVYQVCVMKEAGMVDDQTAKELVRSLMGLDPTDPNSVSPGTTSVTVTTSPATPAPPAPAAASFTLSVTGANPQGMLALDGNDIGALGSGKSLTVGAGSHQLVLSEKKFKPYSTTLDIQADHSLAIPALEKKKKTGLIIGLSAGGVVLVAGIAVAATAGYYY